MSDSKKPLIIDPRNPPPDLSRALHLNVSQGTDEQDKERVERELAAKHGATECAEKGHEWDIAAMGGGMWAFDCLRADCKLIHDSEEGYTWEGQPA